MNDTKSFIYIKQMYMKGFFDLEENCKEKIISEDYWDFIIPLYRDEELKEVNPEKAREACEKVILEFGQRKGRKMNLPADANAQQFIEGVANGPAFYSFDMVYDKLSPDDSGSCVP